MFNIILNQEAVAVLLRCLGYGGAAISARECEDGTAAIIDANIQMIRKSVCNGLFKEIITQTLERQFNAK